MSAVSGIRQHRALIGGLLLVVALVAVIASLRPGGESGYLGTGEKSADGSLALVRLLRSRGVSVQAAESGPAAVSAATRAPARTTVLITSAGRVSTDLARRLVASGARLVLVSPASRQLAAALPSVRTAGPATSPDADPGCDLPAARRAGMVDLSGSTYAVRTGARANTGTPSPTVCYEASAGASLIRVPGTDRRPAVDVLGSDLPLRNAKLAEGGAAALALNLLGERPRLVWYRPAELDRIEPGQPGRPLVDLLPGWVGPVSAQLVIAAALLGLARGRRIGPVVPERLPVVVAAGETTAGRARLYRRHRSRDAAAAALRDAAIRDLGPRVGRTGVTRVDAGLVAALAARSGLADIQVHHLLGGGAPPDDAALTQLVRELTDLNERTRRA